jgi:hypothetical protein
MTHGFETIRRDPIREGGLDDRGHGHAFAIGLGPGCGDEIGGSLKLARRRAMSRGYRSFSQVLASF